MPNVIDNKPLAVLDGNDDASFFNALLEGMPDRIFFKDRQSRFLKCSQALARRLGAASPAEVLGKTDFDFNSREIAEECFKDEQQIIKSGIPIIGKTEKHTLKDGSVQWTSTTKVPVRNKTGEIVGLMGINRNITGQVLAEAALRDAHDDLESLVAARTAELTRKNGEMEQERRLLRTLIDHMPDGIYAKDSEARKTMSNLADLKTLGVATEAEAIGKTDFDLFPKEIAAKFHEDDMRVIQTGVEVINREEFYIDQDGNKRWLLTSKLPLRDVSGGIVGLVGVGRDITTLKEVEKKAEHLQQELQEASRAAGMAEVATGVLHNVGNVLNSVNVSVEVIAEHLRDARTASLSKLATLLCDQGADAGRFLEQDERGKQIPSYLKQLAGFIEQERARMRREVDNLKKNIEHIKEIVATQQSYARLCGVSQTLAVPDLIEDAFRIHGGAYARHGVNVEREYDPLPEITVDKHRVLQILVNLLHNAKYACDASPKDEKKVVIRLKALEGGRLKIEVADNGIGIAKEDLTRIFSQGFSTRKGGHGFGLHSGALTAKELGGSLSVNSDGIGQGATFSLELPVSPPAQKQRKQQKKVSVPNGT